MNALVLTHQVLSDTLYSVNTYHKHALVYGSVSLPLRVQTSLESVFSSAT